MATFTGGPAVGDVRRERRTHIDTHGYITPSIFLPHLPHSYGAERLGIIQLNHAKWRITPRAVINTTELSWAHTGQASAGIHAHPHIQYSDTYKQTHTNIHGLCSHSAVCRMISMERACKPRGHKLAGEFSDA